MAKSTVSRQKSKTVKPSKPRTDFPLFPHASGKWAKVIKGRTFYFGRWDDPNAAEAEYLQDADDLHAGREPRPEKNRSGPTLREVCNAFIKSKRTKLDSGNLSPRTFMGYDKICRFLLDAFGRNRSVSDLGPADFENLYAKLGQKFSTTSLGGQITQIRSIFKHAFEADLIDRPVKYGPSFKAPSKQDVRKAKAKAKHQNGSRTFEAVEIRQMIATADPQLKGMILLGINCGFGNTDCAGLVESALDLKNNWVDFPRSKTGAERKVPLWPETVDALREAIKIRKQPADENDEGLIFITKYGMRWVRFELVESKRFGKLEMKVKAQDAITLQIGKLLKKLNLKRPGLSFYSLRHTFETVAGGSRDQVAVDAVMGHIDSSMAANYRHGIDDDRLKAVVDHVRDWLFADGGAGR